MSNIEQYTITYLNQAWDVYKEYLKKNKGQDIDYPGYEIKFGN
jgi:hypothetical protein